MNKPSPIWHPMTQHGSAGPEIHIERAEGAYLYAKDGRRILDGISSWWVITHGHCHPKIAAAVKDQADRLEQVIFAGFTHEPAEALTEKLLSVTDPTLEYAFYSDSGSTAIEVALKMAIGYFEHTGKPRKKIIALEGGYHGDTFGAMAAGARSVFNKIYEPYLFNVEHLPFPQNNTPSPSQGEGWGEGQKDGSVNPHDSMDPHPNPPPTGGGDCLGQFEALLKGGDVAALILEPLILGADGMKIYAPEMLKALHGLCKQYGALLIADEVMTGFGRTGTRFACEQVGIVPDLLCLSKGVTGGFLPMGVTLATKDIYNAFYHDDRAKQFFHSTSFTGNPLACRAALANLEIWDEEPVFEKIEVISAAHSEAKTRFAQRDDVGEVRHLGSILALDVIDETDGYLSSLGPALYKFYLENDILLRPIGNTVYILPPYCVTEQDLEQIYDCITRSLDYLRDERRQCAA